MYVDNFLLVSDAQAVAGADTDVSTHSIDLGTGTPTRRVGTGEPLGFGVAIDVAAVTSGGETYTFQVIQSDNANLSSPQVVASYPFSAAQLAQGALSFLPIPPGFPTKRYLGLQVAKTGAAAAVTFTAWLTARDLFSVAAQAYQSGYVV
jgi:hypothetical protein